MSTKDKDLFPAASDVVFAENFRNNASVANNGGTISGNPVIENGVGVFDGTGDYISYPKPDFNYGGNFTVAGWINIGATTGNTAIFGQDTDGTYKVLFYQAAGGTNMYFYVVSASGTAYTPAYSFGLSTWRHFVCVYDSSLASNRLKLYMNGAIASQVNGYAENVTTPVGKFEIGNYITDFNGSIKDLKIINRSWTAQECLDDFQGSTFNYENKNVLNLPMHDKIGSAAPFTTSDLSGKGYDATYGDGTTASTFPTKASGDNYNTYDGGDYLTVADNRNLDITGQMTVSCWVRPTATTGNCAIIGRPGGATYKWLLYQAPSTSNFYFYVITASGSTSSGLVALPQNKWSMITGVYDKSLSSSRVQIYVDKGNVLNSANGYNEDMVDQTGLAINIGKYIANFRGDIGPVGLWKFPLTKTQRLNEYYKGRKYLG